LFKKAKSEKKKARNEGQGEEKEEAKRGKRKGTHF
jgi:hypothetical protein